jgi:hypothetical protein
LPKTTVAKLQDHKKELAGFRTILHTKTNSLSLYAVFAPFFRISALPTENFSK